MLSISQVARRSAFLLIGAIHVWQGCWLAVGGSAANVTSIHGLVEAVGGERWVAAAMLIFVGAVAFLVTSRQPWAPLVVIPQEIILALAAWSALDAIWASAFADGEVRPRPFIASDQGIYIMLFLGHTLALFSGNGVGGAVAWIKKQLHS